MREKQKVHFIKIISKIDKTLGNAKKLPGQMNMFLCILPLSMLWIFAFFVFNNLNTFTVTRLFKTVPCNHVQLPNLVLKNHQFNHFCGRQTRISIKKIADSEIFNQKIFLFLPLQRLAAYKFDILWQEPFFF